VADVDCFIDAPRQAVFAVLADGWTYSSWVVGTSHIRAVDAAWPAAGSKLHHASGAWPLAIRDETVVDTVDLDRRLELTVRGRPFGQAKVVIELADQGAGTRLTMSEWPSAGPGRWLHTPVGDALLHRRNVESLARLTAIAERHTSPPD
jgi:uncharacterized protein YndB with AHSA1/START domain